MFNIISGFESECCEFHVVPLLWLKIIDLFHIDFMPFLYTLPYRKKTIKYKKILECTAKFFNNLSKT